MTESCSCELSTLLVDQSCVTAMADKHASNTLHKSTKHSTFANDDLRSYTVEPAFRRLLTLVQLTCVQPAVSDSKLTAAHSVLIVSPPGTGKTAFLRLLAFHYQLPLIHISPIALSPSSLSAAFDDARRQQPSLLCMDDADLLLPRLSDDETWHHTLLSRFLDQLASLSASTDRVLLVLLCSTTAVLRLAPAVRSAVEVTLEAALPTAAHRLSLLHHFVSPLCEGRSAAHTFPFLPAVVAECGGMSGADLSAVVHAAAQHALSDERDMLTYGDFQAALQLVSASSAAGSVKVDSEARVEWDDIVGMQEVKRQMQDCLIPLLSHCSTATAAPSLLTSLRSPPGVLLYGPPGTGQSLSQLSSTVHAVLETCKADVLCAVLRAYGVCEQARRCWRRRCRPCRVCPSCLCHCRRCSTRMSERASVPCWLPFNVRSQSLQRCCSSTSSTHSSRPLPLRRPPLVSRPRCARCWTPFTVSDCHCCCWLHRTCHSCSSRACSPRHDSASVCTLACRQQPTV